MKQVTINVRDRRTGTKIYTAKVKGTTYSGHPTRTTLGNTIRVISYISFAAYLAGYQHIYADH